MNLLFALVPVLLVAPVAAGPREPADGVVFCSYNVRNYAGPAAAGSRTAAPKPEKEIETLIRIIRDIDPDILGVCEMGSPEMFADFRTRLEKAGVRYVDSEYVQADDAERRLALLSRFPIVRRDSVTTARFTLNGVPTPVRRGFLDVTLQILPGYQLRCVGVHLKSKLAAAEGEALIRRHEAAKLREHIDGILDAAPATNLLCYGDFNDAKNQPVITEVTGVRGTARHMTDLRAADAQGDRWTHHWPEADVYSRIDYLFASPGLVPEVKRDSATVFRSADWSAASDHRPVFVTILPAERRR